MRRREFIALLGGAVSASAPSPGRCFRGRGSSRRGPRSSRSRCRSPSRSSRWRSRSCWSLVSRPLARGADAAVRKLDRARPRDAAADRDRGRRRSSAVVVYVIWRVMVKPRVGTLDLSVLYPPVVALLATATIHALWQRLGRARRVVGYAFGRARAGIDRDRARYRVARRAQHDARDLGRAADRRPRDRQAVRPRHDPRTRVARRVPPDREGRARSIPTSSSSRSTPCAPITRRRTAAVAEMPLLRELGVRGAVFDWAFAPSNVTRRSIPSMVTGLAPNRVRGRVVGWALRIDPRHVLRRRAPARGRLRDRGLCVLLRASGATTSAPACSAASSTSRSSPNGTKLAKQARDWLDARDEAAGDRKPLFLWMHILEPHNWQRASAPRQRRGAPRDSTIAR